MDDKASKIQYHLDEGYRCYAPSMNADPYAVYKSPEADGGAPNLGEGTRRTLQADEGVSEFTVTFRSTQ
jgi:hypothetical protein